MKRALLVFAALALLLGACRGEAAEVAVSVEEERPAAIEQSPPLEIIPEPEPVHEPEPDPEPEELPTPPAPELPPLRFPFVVPVVEHPYAEEMMQLFAEFNMGFTFPPFESLDEMDMAGVGATLYLHAARPFNELADVASDIRVARRDDMTAVGQRFFGQAFYFPRGVYSNTIEPFDLESEFYGPTGWGIGPGETKYLRTDVLEDGQYIVATFLSHVIYDFDGQFPDSVLFFTWNLRDVGLFDAHFGFDFEESASFRTGQNVVDYLSAIDYIPVRLADLDTITVTFRREEATGNLIAVSSRRNPLNESVLPFHTYLQVLRGEAEFFEQRSYHSAPDEQSPGGATLAGALYRFAGDADTDILFTLVQIEGSSTPAVILELVDFGGERLVLHYSSERVYGRFIPLRGLSQLRLNGSARWSGGVMHTGTNRLRLVNGMLEAIATSSADSDLAIYIVNGEDATEAETRAVWNAHDDKDVAVWIPFDLDTLAADFAAAWDDYFEWLAAHLQAH